MSIFYIGKDGVKMLSCKLRDIMSKLSTLLTVLIMAVAFMFVSDTSALAAHHSINLVNKIGYTITTVLARPSGATDDKEVFAYIGELPSGESAVVDFDYAGNVKTFDFRVLYGTEGKGYYYIGVKPDSYSRMVLNHDGTVDYGQNSGHDYGRNDARASKAHFSFTLVNRIGYNITTVLARPTGAADSEEVIAYMGNLRSGSSDTVEFDFDRGVGTFDLRVLYGTEGKGYYYIGVQPDSISRMILNHDGTVSYR